MNGYDLPLEATTIHRLLGVSRNGHDKKGWGFIHNAANPLPYRFVFVDEVSMLDVDLAANLFAACQPGTHILLIGDTGQLPPVGHGAPLRDLIAAGVGCGELTEIWRNAGDIVKGCSPFAQADRSCRVRHWTLTPVRTSSIGNLGRPVDQWIAWNGCYKTSRRRSTGCC